LKLRSMLTLMQKTARMTRRVVSAETEATLGICEEALGRLQRVLDNQPVADLYRFAANLIESCAAEPEALMSIHPAVDGEKTVGEQASGLGIDGTQNDDSSVRQSPIVPKDGA